MSGPLATALMVLAGFTLYAGIQSLFNAYYRPQRRMYVYFALMCIFAIAYIFIRLHNFYSNTTEDFISLQRLGFLAAQLLFLSQIGFVTEYTNWRPRWLVSVLVISLLALLIINLFLPYGLAHSSLPVLQQFTLPWGETIIDTRIHDKTLWWHLQWISIVGVFFFQFAAAFRQRKTEDRQRGNALLWFGGIFFAAAISNILINFQVLIFTQLAEFGIIAMITLMILHLNREARETQLRAVSAENIWSSLVMHAPNFILLLDREGVIHFINHALLDKDQDSVFGTQFKDYLQPDSQGLMHSCLNKVVSNNESVSAQLQLNTSDPQWLDVHMAPVSVGESYKQIVMIATDISERMQMENELRQSEEKFRQLAENINQVFYIRDLASNRMLYVSPAYETIWGRSREELYNESEEFITSIHPDDKVRVLQLFTQQKRDNRFFNVEYRILDKHGAIHWVNSRRYPIRDEHGKLQRIAGIVEDITQRKQTEAALRDSAEKYRTLMEYASDIILVADLAGNLIECNGSALAVLGYSREELLKLHVSDIHPTEELARNLTSFQHLIETGSVITNDTALLRHDGQPIPVDINANIIEYQGRKVAVGFMRDIRARKQVEEQHRQTEHRHREMLVREVHHRIKNNLQGVIGLLRNSLNDEEDITEVSERLVTRAISQIATIATVHGLQARFSDGAVRICDITHAVVDQSRTYAASDIHIEFQDNVSRPALLKEAEAIPLALVINELVTNAVKHIPVVVKNKQVIVKFNGNPTDGIELRIFNSGARLPPDLHTRDQSQSAVGLDLIHALLPRQHTRFSLADDPVAGGVLAILRIEPAILSEVIDVPAKATADDKLMQSITPD